MLIFNLLELFIFKKLNKRVGINSSDYPVENADSVTDALELHRQCSFDVIFSDLKLLRDTSETDTVAEAIELFKEMNPQLTKAGILESSISRS